MFGIILMVLLLRIFHFHQHEFGDEAGDFHHDMPTNTPTSMPIPRAG